MNWTDERVELLKKLWADGLSASQIAAELGGVTRNAVIGKVHRLGLSGRAKAVASTTPRPRKPRPVPSAGSRPVVVGNTALAQVMRPMVEPEPVELPDPVANVVPMAERCTILDLTEFTCRWPVGEPGKSDFFYCGSRTKTGMPYCAYHARIAYQPVQDRNRRRVAR
ncbi:GcrA family cell cycle regulator [Starkeya koreensis]|uniref:GcrA family cell cycle regulator n=1 Tax=Ancylobacter koreensis TaxID=266121 RepID=A0ABT0DJ14_9HYPH|nr:GcrA family cell cycle regulator [Ancylobacter koreensis]MCK0207271.1 GcrA family cell cycle regulator [Ancylobacter koreensis]